MKTKISIILLIFSFVFLFFGTTLFEKTEKSFDEKLGYVVRGRIYIILP